MRYIAQGMKRDTALCIASISKHQYYYRPVSKKKAGRPCSEYTIKDGKSVTNKNIVEEIQQVKADPDTDYGYRRMYYHLMQMGYLINHKKIYRLMKEADLLKKKVRPGSEKSYVKYRMVTPERPLQVLEMDIKMVWVTEHRRHAYILTILDTFTRAVLYWRVGYCMKQQQVKQAWCYVIEYYLQPYDLLKEQLHVELRNDNGPQFSSNMIQNFMKENHIDQVFTHPYTPQENGHVESFHSILKEALGKQPFWSLLELENRLKVFYQKYNQVRIHSSIAHLAPFTFWQCWENNLIERIEVGKKKVKFKLKIPYQQLSGNESLREVLCSNEPSPNGEDHLYYQEEVNGANTSILQPSV
jgi:putative transposase